VTESCVRELLTQSDGIKVKLLGCKPSSML